MHVLVTGATGFIGQAAVKELLSHGHKVLGLTRNEANDAAITAAGGTPLRGDIQDLESLKRGAQAADGVVHLAFMSNLDFAAACEVDYKAIKALAEALQGTGKPLVTVTGTLVVKKDGSGVAATEDTEMDRQTPPLNARVKGSDLVREFSEKGGVRGTVVRFAPTVHKLGKGGLTRAFIDKFKASGGPVFYVNDGSARWPGCDVDDAAAVVRLALEKGKPGSTFHAVAEEGVSLKEQMTFIGKKLNRPVESRTLDEAVATLGMFGYLMAADNPCSSEKTKQELGWQPHGPGVIEDFDANFPY